jgi:hypothetical protein
MSKVRDTFWTTIKAIVFSPCPRKKERNGCEEGRRHCDQRGYAASLEIHLIDWWSLASVRGHFEGDDHGHGVCQRAWTPVYRKRVASSNVHGPSFAVSPVLSKSCDSFLSTYLLYHISPLLF